jgi:hypothetical protein
MKSFGKFLITACLLLVVTATQTVLAQTTSILVRRNGTGQPNIPVICTTTNEVKYTSVNDTGSGSTLIPKGTARFTNGITDVTKYYAYYGGCWHPCSPCNEIPVRSHLHCELPNSIVVPRFLYDGDYVPDLPVIIVDRYNNQVSEVLYTATDGYVTFCPPLYVQNDGYYIAYQSSTTGNALWATDASGNRKCFYGGNIHTQNLPSNSMVLQLDPAANNATITTLASYPYKTYKWKAVQNASGYDLLIQKAGQQCIEHYSITTYCTDSASAGSWRWQVIAYDKNGKVLAKSPVKYYTVVSTSSH